MKLTQLKEAAERAIEYATECGVDPETIPVTLQLDNSVGESIWSDDEVALHWDNDTCASGCVLTAFVEAKKPEVKKLLKIEVIGQGAVFAAKCGDRTALGATQLDAIRGVLDPSTMAFPDLENA